jgi:2-hydroxychromene-2-carboxylate isomerase
MSRTIDYVFSLASPWAYLGFDLFHAAAAKHGATVRYRPMSLGEVFSETGGLPLGKRHPIRQGYRLMELQRWRAARKVALNIHPKFWPLDPSLADKVAIALADAGRSPEAYLRLAHRAIWAEERNMADEAVIAAVLTEAGESASVIEAAKGASAAAAYAANRDWAIANGAFGSPGYTLDGEFFWGQDRIELLESALASGRPPYLADSDR